MLQILTRATLARIILQPFVVRVHVGIARYPWARLWYLARGFDPSGRGIVDLPADIICQLLAVSKPTLYEWLRDGKNAGAFRDYKFKGNCLHIWLGGLPKVCATLGLESWGATATVSLLDVKQLRALATGIATAELQKKSHYAARRSLKHRERSFFTPPTADAILAEGERSSQKPAKGQVPFLLWVGASKVFVSKGFVPFGASQAAIAVEVGICDRTVRRHQRQLDLERRQLVQAKHAYKLVSVGIEWDSDECFAEPDIWYQGTGDAIRLFEPNGISSSSRPGGHPISRQRFFNYRGKTWIYRCNLYSINFSFNSMKAARHQYKLLMQNFGRAGGEGGISIPDQRISSGGFKNPGKISDPPGKEGQNP